MIKGWVSAAQVFNFSLLLPQPRLNPTHFHLTYGFQSQEATSALSLFNLSHQTVKATAQLFAVSWLSWITFPELPSRVDCFLKDKDVAASSSKWFGKFPTSQNMVRIHSTITTVPAIMLNYLILPGVGEGDHLVQNWATGIQALMLVIQLCASSQHSILPHQWPSPYHSTALLLNLFHQMSPWHVGENHLIKTWYLSSY